MHIAFLGLGATGAPMAQSLVGLGHEVIVHHPEPEQAEALAASGVVQAATLAQAVAGAEVVITVAADEDALSVLVQGPEGLLALLPPTCIHLCMSPIGIKLSAELAAAHARANQGYVAAPAFGREGQSGDRHLWFVAGGPEPHVNRCLPIFVALGRGLTRVGPKAALAHALKLGGDLVMESLLDGTPALFSACQEAGVAPDDFLRLLKAEFFKAPLGDVLGTLPIPEAGPSLEFSSEFGSNEMLTLLQAAAEVVAARPVAAPPRGRPRTSPGRGAKGATPPVPPEAPLCRDPSPEAAGPEGPPPPLPPQAVMAEPPASPPCPMDEPAGPPARAAVGPPPPPLPLAEEAEPPWVQTPPQGAMPESRPVEDPTLTVPAKAADSEKHPIPPRVDPANTFMALEDGEPVLLDLGRTSHFEVIKGQVWAWSQDRAYRTSWRSLRDVELAFSHLLFHAIQRHILLRPEAVLDLRNTFGGGAKVRVGERQELEVSRSATPRLKVLLGL